MIESSRAVTQWREWQAKSKFSLGGNKFEAKGKRFHHRDTESAEIKDLLQSANKARSFLPSSSTFFLCDLCVSVVMFLCLQASESA